MLQITDHCPRAQKRFILLGPTSSKERRKKCIEGSLYKFSIKQIARVKENAVFLSGKVHIIMSVH